MVNSTCPAPTLAFLGFQGCPREGVTVLDTGHPSVMGVCPEMLLSLTRLEMSLGL